MRLEFRLLVQTSAPILLCGAGSCQYPNVRFRLHPTSQSSAVDFLCRKGFIEGQVPPEVGGWMLDREPPRDPEGVSKTGGCCLPGHLTLCGVIMTGR